MTIHNTSPVTDYPNLLALLGADEFERTICTLAVSRERYRGYEEGRAEGYAVLEVIAIASLAEGGKLA